MLPALEELKSELQGYPASALLPRLQLDQVERWRAHEPVFVEEDVVHYCVTNMPGAMPFTSTMALTNATIKYALDLANKGFIKATKEDPALAKGVNTIDGHVTYKGVADAFKLKYEPLETVI
jgi:alanine dehydrogenase